MTQHLDMVRAMADRTGLPIVADIDTGFGNAVNVIYAVRQYERAGAAAWSSRTRPFRRSPAWSPDGRQELVRIEEFQGKIEAARAARERRGFPASWPAPRR